MKILYVTTIGRTMSFFRSFIKELIDDGNEVDIATNECGGEAMLDKCFREWGCNVYPISCLRSPFSYGNIKAIREIRTLVTTHHYDIVHCHTPIAAACTRLACRKLRNNQQKVFYTVHGFHFYSGAPVKNWILYYPIEWLCSWWTDVLITINREDYKRAKKKLHSKNILYVPGVGVDVLQFKANNNGMKIREELGIKKEFLLLSVGELNENKNHEAVIKAISDMDNVTYVIVGHGEKKEQLIKKAKECSSRVILTGFRPDVADFYNAADAYILPSIREGLNVSLMEAMASGLPCIVGDIRGNRDLIENESGGYLFDPTNVEMIRDCIIKIRKANRKEMGVFNISKVERFSIDEINKKMKKIYYGWQ